MPVECRYRAAHLVLISAGFPVTQQTESVLCGVFPQIRQLKGAWARDRRVFFLWGTEKELKLDLRWDKNHAREEGLVKPLFANRHLKVLNLNAALFKQNSSYISHSWPLHALKTALHSVFPLLLWFHVLPLYCKLIPLTAPWCQKQIPHRRPSSLLYRPLYIGFAQTAVQ